MQPWEGMTIARGADCFLTQWASQNVLYQSLCCGCKKHINIIPKVTNYVARHNAKILNNLTFYAASCYKDHNLFKTNNSKHTKYLSFVN